MEEPENTFVSQDILQVIDKLAVATEHICANVRGVNESLERFCSKP
jgi:hypothetical protein